MEAFKFYFHVEKFYVEGIKIKSHAIGDETYFVHHDNIKGFTLFGFCLFICLFVCFLLLLSTAFQVCRQIVCHTIFINRHLSDVTNSQLSYTESDEQQGLNS